MMEEENSSQMNYLIFYAIKEYRDSSHVDILHNKMEWLRGKTKHW